MIVNLTKFSFFAASTAILAIMPKRWTLWLRKATRGPEPRRSATRCTATHRYAPRRTAPHRAAAQRNAPHRTPYDWETDRGEL